MRRLLLGALLLGGCQDYGKLEKDFCDTAKVKHFVSEDPDGTIHTQTLFRQFCDDLEKRRSGCPNRRRICPR